MSGPTGYRVLNKFRTSARPRRRASGTSTEIEDRDPTLRFLVVLHGRATRGLMNFDRKLEAWLLPLVPAPLLFFALPYLLDDERG